MLQSAFTVDGMLAQSSDRHAFYETPMKNRQGDSQSRIGDMQVQGLRVLSTSGMKADSSTTLPDACIYLQVTQ
jgi:hypothetical protein